MDSAAVKSLSPSAKSPSLMAFRPCYGSGRHPTKASPFPQPPAPPQPPLLPLPVHLQASPQRPSCPATASRAVPRAKKQRHATPSPRKPADGATAPIDVAAPSKKRTAAAAAAEQQDAEWTTGYLYSVSPPPSSVPMPTSLLATAGRKAPTACAVEVAGGGGGVDASATDELRRLLRL